MALEDWQQEFISNRKDVEGLDRQVWEQILATVLFGEGPMTRHDAVEAMAKLAEDAKNRDYAAFIRVGRAQADLKHLVAEREAAEAASEAAPASSSESDELHPDLDDRFSAVLDGWLRVPDTRAAHAHALTALLQGIQHMAEQAQEPETLNTLADAYLRLPSPIEDADNG